MNFARRSVLALLFTLAPLPLAGQVAAKFEPFRIPGAELECETLSPSPEDPRPGSAVMSFSEGEELVDERLIDVGYDSAGTPLWLLMLADELLGTGTGDGRSQAGWRVVMHGYFVTFAADGSASGFHKPGLTARDPRPVARGNAKVLPAEAAAEARRLAQWLWNHRCGVTIAARWTR